MEQLPIFKNRKFVVLAAILAIVFIWQTFFYVKDQILIKKINEQVSWLEQFYTNNARFPSESEFDARYNHGQRPITSGWPGYTVTPEGQIFSLKYKLHFENQSTAIGRKAHADLIGSYTYTEVTPCHRWKKLSEFAPKLEMKGLKADLDTGKITLINYPEKTILTGLKQPRFLNAWPGFNSSYTSENEIFITNGSGVFRYTWNQEALILDNPEKIADVPTTCPVDTNYDWPVVN